MTWGQLVADRLLIGRDAERNHRGERCRGPISDLYFAQEGLVIERHWVAVCFDSDGDRPEWEIAHGRHLITLPRISRDNEIKGNNYNCPAAVGTIAPKRNGGHPSLSR